MKRSTRQRDAIKSALRNSNRPLSPDEVLQAARAHVRALGIATVYRNLKLLLDDGSIQAVSLPGEALRYETSASAHHHHFQCTACRRIYDVAGCPGDMRRFAPRGFTVERHDLTLYGRCLECA